MLRAHLFFVRYQLQSVPVAELERRLNELPRDQSIVACCRGPYCVYAYDAVEILRDAGLDARRLDGGFLEWKVNGFLVITEKSTI